MPKVKNFKKEREDKLNLYLTTVWDEIQGDRENSVFNTVINKRLGWLQPETDNVSDYAAEIKYTEVKLGGEVFLIDGGIIRAEEIICREKYGDLGDLIELSTIEEITDVEEFIDMGWLSVTVQWVKGLFSK